MIEGPANQSWWKRSGRGLSESFRWHDVLTLLLGGIVGFVGNALHNRDISTGASLLTLGILTLCAVISISRFRAETQSKTIATIQEFHEELQGKLRKNLNQVHATVSFIPEASGASVAVNSKRGYDAGTAAVLRARKQISIVGDYCPPPGEGAALDKLPEHRSEFLQAIEAMLAKRLEGDPDSAPLLEYRRFIQRPINVYNMIKGREMAGNPGITLESGDMVGDMQVFEHCMRVLDIVTRAETQGGERIRVQIKVIPFLPNCPSVLLVDDRDVQFIIPTRIDSPGDKCAQQGLLGTFVLEDKAGGSEVCYPFKKLFDKLAQFSAAVIRVRNGNHK